jgi:hypothetical protein
MEGTALVDADQIKQLIRALDQKNKIYDALFNKNLRELSEKFVYDPKLSEEENRKRFFETVWPRDITNDDSPTTRLRWESGRRMAHSPVKRGK